MKTLFKTTIYELAMYTDELEMEDSIVFTTEDPEELEHYKLNPTQYNIIRKTRIFFEDDYVIAIGLLDGKCTLAKDISILTNGNIDDEDERIDGIEKFIQEYYDNYAPKNGTKEIYLFYP